MSLLDKIQTKNEGVMIKEEKKELTYALPKEGLIMPDQLEELNQLEQKNRELTDLVNVMKGQLSVNQAFMKEQTSLMKETTDLNDLMRGYLRTMMDKSGAEKMTFDTEIDNIKITSKQVTDQMLSILTKQERLLNLSAETLQKAMNERLNEMHQNNNRVLEQMEQIGNQVNQQMSEIKSTTKTAMESISSHNLQRLNDLSQGTDRMISNARKGIRVNHWLDAVKYGGTGAFIALGGYYLLHFLKLI
jgi:hypothetical protein